MKPSVAQVGVVCGHQEAQRIAQQQAETGDQQGDLEGVPEHPQVQPSPSALAYQSSVPASTLKPSMRTTGKQEEGEQEDEGGQCRKIPCWRATQWRYAR
jgi:hypothetical protein